MTERDRLSHKYGILLDRHNRYRMRSHIGPMIGAAKALDVVKARLGELM